MSALEQLGETVAGVGKNGLPPEIAEAVRLHIADIVGAWVAGAATPEGQALLALRTGLRAQPGFGSYGDTVLDRVMTHCAVARLSEIDDIHTASGTTPGGVVVPAVLTVAAVSGVSSGADIAAAVAAGYEAMIRLGLALDGPTILYRGIWPTYFAAPFGVAAATARLLGLGPAQTTHALGLALTWAAPGVGHHGGSHTSRWLSVGHAARNGAMAAFSARAGFVADLRLLEGPFFHSIFAITPDLDLLTAGTGTEVTQVSFKPWCAARQTMAAVQGLKEIIADGVDPADIEELLVAVPGLYFNMIDHGVVAGDRTSHLTSVSYQLALAALAPDAMYDVVQTPDETAPEIAAFMAKVRVEVEPGLLTHYPRVWPARLTVTAGREKRELLMTRIPGDPELPFDEARLSDKFRRVVGPVTGAGKAETLLALALGALDGEGGATTLIEGIAAALL